MDVACALEEAHRRQVQQHNQNATRYARILQRHIDAFVYLAAQGITFRGHDESALSSNRGNFIELLDVIGNYSADLKTFLDREKITYTSHEPQNDLIECIYEKVKQEVAKRAVMMDDTSDCSNVEQSAVSIRLVHKGEVEEHLLGMINCSNDQSADALSKILLQTLKEYDISPKLSRQKLIGQSYDGAATMSGELNGVQKKMQDRFPSAYYSHCVAHRLALCASQSSSSIPKVAKFFDTVDKLIRFFRSSTKRTDRLGRRLPLPGDTCWLSRDTAIAAIDSMYEVIGTILYKMAFDDKEKLETQVTARGLCSNIQNIEFVFLLKLYRKIFAHCAPIMTLMQNPELDAVQLSMMLEDFQKFLSDLNIQEIWDAALQLDPVLPSIGERSGWRGIEGAVDGSRNTWKNRLSSVSQLVVSKFSAELQWRSANLEKYEWMDLIHPAKFEERKKLSSNKQKELIEALKQQYPFAVPDKLALEHNLNVLYNNSQIQLLLEKRIRDRDEMAAKKKERRPKLKRANEEQNQAKENERMAVEEENCFERMREKTIEEEGLKEGKPNIQDLLEVIKDAGLEEALSFAVTLLELAITIPLTSLHCERVFSRMKRIVSSSRSKMLQKRKEMLVFLQVEHKLLRHLAAQPDFKKNVVLRFKNYNQPRYERFSKK